MLHRPARLSTAIVGALFVVTLSLSDHAQPGAMTRASSVGQDGVDLERLVD